MRSPRRRVAASKDLNRMPTKVSRWDRSRARRRHGDVGVLVGVAFVLGNAGAGETVLEVDAQILDRFGAQFDLHEREDGVGQFGFDAGDRGEVRGTVDVGVEDVECVGSPPCCDPGVVAVGRDVDGVHRLAGTVGPGIGRGVCRVGVRELRVERSRKPVQSCRHPNSCPVSTAVYVVVRRRYRRQVMCSVNCGYGPVTHRPERCSSSAEPGPMPSDRRHNGRHGAGAGSRDRFRQRRGVGTCDRR